MSITEFYMQSTGSNLNAGSTNSDAASLTYASGNWVQSTGVFTVASGNPQSDGVQVGQWASVYANGSTNTGFVGQVTAVDSTTITVSLTTTIGTTVPTDGTGNRTLKIGGAWASFDGLTTTGSALQTSTTVTFAWRLNIKAATYSGSGNSRSFGVGGGLSAPVILRGYTSTPGDIDGHQIADLVAGTDYPLFSDTFGGRFTFQKTALQLINLAFLTSGVNNITLTLGGSCSKAISVKAENTNSGSSASALSLSGGGNVLDRCWFKAPTTATRVVNITAAAVLVGCYIEGGTVCADFSSPANHSKILCCLFTGPANDAIALASVSGVIHGCTIYSCGRDGIRFSGTMSSPGLLIANCILDSCTGIGINNSPGSNAELFLRTNNLFHANGTDESGFTDSLAFWAVADSGSPFTNAGAGDFTPVDSSNAIGNGSPGLFLGTSLTSYLDIGAVQRQGGGGGGSGAHSVLRSSLIRGAK